MHLCSPTPRALRSLLLPAALAAMLCGSSGWAQGQTATLHRQYQAVNADGSSAWSGSGPIVMTGVVINNYWDMLNYSDDPNSPNFSTSPQWQVFFQATEEAKSGLDQDFGGTAMYMRRYHPWFKDPDNPDLPLDLYPDHLSPTWAAEMERLNYPLGTGEPSLRRGDLIEVVANAPGMFFGGKRNINTTHRGPASTYEPPLSYDNFTFSITILDRDQPLMATPITLAHLKYSDPNEPNFNDFIFDQSRETGCEYYQASLVRLEYLLLDDNPANWILHNTVNVRQGDLTFPMQLGIDPALAGIDANTLLDTPFHVTAIMNQESGGEPHTGGYRLWLTNAADLTVVPEPGTALLAMLGIVAALLVPRRRRFR